MKRIKLTLDVDEHFVRMLNATCQLERLIGSEQKGKLTALQALGVVVLGEARGAHTEQTHIMTPIEWRAHIEPVGDKREVYEISAQPERA